MKKCLFIQTGFGVDVHGQDVTKAAVRAVNHAIYHNSMSGIKDLLPGKDLNNMCVTVKLAIPTDVSELDVNAVKARIPFGTVTVETQRGGMVTTHGIVIPEKGDKNDLMYIVNASVEAGY
ncbi:Lin0512 family protein [Brochothrix campestris]|uniref:Lin0512 family protein n=1 Tax=Brochothrix campestris FSL F6-1037 TaxID=1265861 RepID=W7CLY4_9LIST|nr:Lin0512 family protein [Brochothrix campestris]EUJ38027.1 hypothetical protein BCAMP_09220 [Brochothrix campestris FSL F6-1037]